MLALYCMLLEKQCRRKQRSCWQKRRYADDQRFVSNHTQLQHPCCWFGKCTLKILVNFKWCFACQLIASTARRDGFRDTLAAWMGRRSKKHRMTMIFQVKFALRRSARQTTCPDGRLDGPSIRWPKMLTVSTAVRTGCPDGRPCVSSLTVWHFKTLTFSSVVRVKTVF